MTTETVVDARGLKCPLPVLKAERQLALLAGGATLTVLATDPMAKIDIPLFCRQNDHRCTVTEAAGELRFVILKGTA